MAINKEEIFEALRQVKDPEIPVLDVVEMGIVRDVAHVNNTIQVDITPTYSGCPAMQVIEHEIAETLLRIFGMSVTVRKVFSPPWTTEWMTKEARNKLRQYGISPPLHCGKGEALVSIKNERENICCPLCGEAKTELRSEYGSTACKSLYFCLSCKEPFEYFKEI